jgi:hypothetical protein
LRSRDASTTDVPVCRSQAIEMIADIRDPRARVFISVGMPGEKRKNVW